MLKIFKNTCITLAKVCIPMEDFELCLRFCFMWIEPGITATLAINQSKKKSVSLKNPKVTLNLHLPSTLISNCKLFIMSLNATCYDLCQAMIQFIEKLKSKFKKNVMIFAVDLSLTQHWSCNMGTS